MTRATSLAGVPCRPRPAGVPSPRPACLPWPRPRSGRHESFPEGDQETKSTGLWDSRRCRGRRGAASETPPQLPDRGRWEGVKRGATRGHGVWRSEASTQQRGGARHDTPQKPTRMGGRGRGGAEACRLPQPCGPQTDPLGPAPFPPASPPSPTAPGVSVPGTGVVGVSSPHCRGQETEAQRRTPPHPRSCWDQGVGGGPPARVCREQGSPEAVSPRREGGTGQDGSLPSTWIRRSLPRT